MRTDTRKNRAVSISTRLSFLAVNKSGAKMTATGGDNLNPCPSA
jgi:hypothetical protein